MRVARTLASALLILTGAACLVAWVLGSVTVRAVTDPQVVATVVSGATSQTQVRESVVTLVQSEVRSQISAQGVDLSFLGLGGMIDGALRRALTSDNLTQMAQDQAVDIQQQLASELKRDDRPPGPLILYVDVSSIVNDALSEVSFGVLDLEVETTPVAIQAMEADFFEQARSTFSLMEFAARWCGWLGLLALTLGMVLSPRRRWFVTKAAAAVAAGAVVLWALVTLTAGPTPVGNDALREAVLGEGAAMVSDRALLVAAIAALIALVSAGIAIATKPTLGRHRA